MASRFDFQGEYSCQVGVDDLVLLTTLDNSSISKNLCQRAAANIIYTYIGHVLIAVNPYKQLPLYGPDAIKGYQGKFRHELPPHVYMVAEDAFRTMTAEEESQCIIISGESGAGKTESAKFIMNYIAAVSKRAQGVEEVKRIVLGSNPLLEAFGNAKTLRNNNSSRFGKYVEMKFDVFGSPCGGNIRNYLLEKSRVVNQTKGERNFHVFYQLVAGADANTRRALHINSVQSFHYLNRSGCVDVPGVDDVQEYKETREAMDMVGLKGKAIDGVFKMVAAVLHFGNIDFEEDGQGSTVSHAGSEALQTACTLLGLDSQNLIQALCFRHMVTKDEEFDVPQNVMQARTARDAVAKTIYSRLFDWLVSCVNDALANDDSDKETLGINVLDIYGFEVFENNGFEQFLINYVNERLQQIFIELTLKAEQDEYQHEGIEWTPIQFFNNKVVCELIEGKNPVGVLLILDDVCKTIHAQSTGADDKFTQKCGEFQGSHQHFTAGGKGFTIQHYAGPVEYNKHGFTASNKDSLIRDLLAVLKASTNKFVQALFPEPLDETAKITSVGFKMKGQCASLVEALMACNPHYVRCIKPNDEKKAGSFDDKRIMHQCKYLGLLENVRVRRAGFAYRQEFHRFNDRYRILVPLKSRGGKSDKEICANMLKYLTPALALSKGEAQLGRTKLFIKKPETLNAAEELRQKKCEEAAAVIQHAWKGYKKREQFVKLRFKVNKYVGKHKERRRESLLRPFVADYVSYYVRPGLKDAVERRFQDGEHMIYADSVVNIALPSLVIGSHSADAKHGAHVYLIISDRKIYLIEHVKQQLPPLRNGQPSPLNDYWNLHREIPLSRVLGMSLSKQADDMIVLHCSNRVREEPPAWVEDNLAPACTRCKASFGLFNRRHHCRQCGQVFCNDCAPDKLASVPDFDMFQPTRVCYGCVGVRSCEVWSDCLWKSFRKTEIFGVLSHTLNKLPSNPPFLNDIECSRHILNEKTQKLEEDRITLHFKKDSSIEEEQGGVITSVSPKSINISCPPGVPIEVMERQNARELQRKKEREAQRQEEQRVRAEMEVERAAQRERERAERIRLKKEKKAQEKSARENAAAATAASSAASGTRRPTGSAQPPPAQPQGFVLPQFALRKTSASASAASSAAPSPPPIASSTAPQTGAGPAVARKPTASLPRTASASSAPPPPAPKPAAAAAAVAAGAQARPPPVAKKPPVPPKGN
eukprot:m.94058 g.94058  ORF g.94058 m.94058 type:complete len:1214 (-) comp15396_c0_seq1:289-3930(-)